LAAVGVQKPAETVGGRPRSSVLGSEVMRVRGSQLVIFSIRVRRFAVRAPKGLTVRL
jgi:hypothetical protein